MTDTLIPSAASLPAPAVSLRERLLRFTRSAVAGSLLSGLSGQALMIVSGVLVARMLGPESRGYVALLFVIGLGIPAIVDLGLPLATTYYLARDPRSARSIVHRLRGPAFLQCAVIITVHAAVLVFLLAEAPRGVQLAGVVSLAIGPAALMNLYGYAILQGQHRFRPFNILRFLMSVFYSVGILALFLAGAAGVFQVVTTWAVVYLGICVASLVLALRGLPSEIEGTPAPPTSEMLRFGLKGMLGSVSPVENFRLDQAVVGVLLSPVALGLYVVAISFTNLPRFVAQSVGVIAYPQIAAQRDRSAARRSVWRYFWFTVGICALIVVALGLTVPWLIPLFFGEEFRGAVALTQILLVSTLFISARRVLSDVVRGAGRPLIGTVGEIAMWIWLVPALVLIVPGRDVEGVALALTLASGLSFVTSIAALIIVNRRRQRVERRAGEEAALA